MTRLTIRFRPLVTRWLAPLMALVLLASLAASALAAGAWTATDAMVYGPRAHAAALLADGRALVAGGYTVQNSTVTCSLTDAQTFEPAAGIWAATGSMNTHRSLHSATTLNDGRVLAVGGVDCVIFMSRVWASTETFDPATGTWSAAGSMAASRVNHTATLLNDGRVLVAGGHDGISLLGSAEVFDPATGTWAATRNLGTARDQHTATLLTDGRVLVAGGRGPDGSFLSSAELFDPATGRWSSTGSLGTARNRHTATLLSDGRVLVAGGWNGAILSSAEVFDAATGRWSPTGSLGTARERYTATLLSDGRVLVAGGFGGTDNLSSAEVFDPAAGSWAATDSMINDRREHTATRLTDGRVLAAGGEGSGGCCAELFTLAAGGGTATPTPTPTASITVVAPNGGEVWPIGSTQTIQWTADGVAGDVKIELSRDGGASYKRIANNVPNTGAYQWTVTKPATTEGLIRVTSIDQPGVQDTSDAVFSLTR